MIIQGDSLTVLKTLESKSVQCCVTSPPYYGLRDYGEDGQIGLEDTPEKYIEKLVSAFREVRRVLKDDGVLWVNIGDSYCGTGDKGNCKDQKYSDGRNGQSVSKNRVLKGCKPKDLIGIPWMLAFALRADGWYLRQDIIWHKPNPMPESVKDRCTKSHEYIFLLSKSQKYYFDNEAIMEKAKYSDEPRANGRVAYGGKRLDGIKNGLKANLSFVSFSKKHKNLEPKGQQSNSFHVARANGEKDEEYVFRNKRDVWSVSTKPYSGAHFATYPEELILPCILAGSKEGDTVLDPFNGAATTGVVCMKNKREYIGIDLNPEYVALSEKRLADTEAEFGVEINQVSIF